jgi:hypothetical protein
MSLYTIRKSLCVIRTQGGEISHCVLREAVDEKTREEVDCGGALRGSTQEPFTLSMDGSQSDSKKRRQWIRLRRLIRRLNLIHCRRRSQFSVLWWSKRHQSRRNDDKDMAYHYLLFFLAGIVSAYWGLTLFSILIYLSLYIATGRKFSSRDALDLSKRQSVIFVLAITLGSLVILSLMYSPLLLLSVFFSCYEEYCEQLTLLGFFIGFSVKAFTYRRRNNRES